MSIEQYRKIMNSEPVGEDVMLKQADGDAVMHAVLVPKVTIGVGSYVTKMSVYVAELGDNLLLGIDFLLTAGAIMNLADHTLTVCGSKVHIDLTGDSTPKLVYSSMSHCVNPGQQLDILVSCDSGLSGEFMFEPAGHWSALNMPNCLIDVGNECRIPVNNLSGSRVRINSQSVLGTLHKVDIVSDTAKTECRELELGVS